eukprot:scaffold14044_cov121-Skeletonema_menzelii.AAC.2
MAVTMAQSTPIQCAILSRHQGDAWTGQIRTLGRGRKITPRKVVFTRRSLALSFSACEYRVGRMGFCSSGSVRTIIS